MARKAGHGHHITADCDDETRTCGQPCLAHGQDMAVGCAQQAGI